MATKKRLLIRTMTMLLLFVGNASQSWAARTADLTGNWTLEATIIVSYPPQFNCSFLTRVGDRMIPVSQTGINLSSVDTDDRGQQFRLHGTVFTDDGTLTEFVTFWVRGFGITPGSGGCSLASRQPRNCCTSENLTPPLKLSVGPFQVRYRYAFQLDNNGNPIWTVVRWTGTFVVTFSERCDFSFDDGEPERCFGGVGVRCEGFPLAFTERRNYLLCVWLGVRR